MFVWALSTLELPNVSPKALARKFGQYDGKRCSRSFGAKSTLWASSSWVHSLCISVKLAVNLICHGRGAQRASYYIRCASKGLFIRLELCSDLFSPPEGTKITKYCFAYWLVIASLCYAERDSKLPRRYSAEGKRSVNLPKNSLLLAVVCGHDCDEAYEGVSDKCILLLVFPIHPFYDG